jgi:dTDP-4-dehydrorhamnose 3,5-epimerase-like enzyme
MTCGSLFVRLTNYYCKEFPVIHGVEIKQLVTHTDERGFFREIIRASDPIFPRGSASGATL